jgi:signal transduction histidine kinase
MLAYIGMYVDMLKSKGNLNPDEFNKLESALQNTLEQVRTLSRTLAPPALQDLGLRDSIRELIASYAILNKPVFELQIYTQREDYNLNMEKKMVVYRILQELLNNTFKYAESKKVTISLYFKEKKFFMEYADDGKGYDPATISKGVGLDSMRSRIAFYKGKLVLESAPGKGSKAHITLPIG